MKLENEPDRWSVWQGDANALATRLAPKSVQAVVTSPPYFGHRRYQAKYDPLELGREASVDHYVARLSLTLAKLRPALRDDGVLWLNLGDTYRDRCLQGIPWRVALRLCEDGWRLRSDVIWHKTNAMPSAVKDRPTVDHEYLFLLANTNAYRYDADAIREPHVTFTSASKMRGGRKHLDGQQETPELGKFGRQNNLHSGRWGQAFHPRGRNKRTVWSIPLGKCREAHLAVFPEALVRPCILATCPPGELVLDPFCGVGTTGMVARALGRRFLGLELSEAYAEVARQRIAGVVADRLESE